MAGHRAKRSQVWYPVVFILCIWGTFDLLAFKAIGVIRCACLKMACGSIAPGRSVKWSEIWDLEEV